MRHRTRLWTRRHRRRTRICALALTLALPLTLGTGCGTPDTTGPAPASRTTSPAGLCTTIITKWARQIYDADGTARADDSTYGDYQSMGLSNGQYQILREILDAARTARRRETTDAGRELITRQARERCAERHRDGGPSGGPWT
ncbi:hypothetical protein JQK87_25060 [Streptomyces sp. G44]|uniref:hypothetical protein n=1 Tax=Streptomyces sp. G44 TaxID=2807632 RepID=UPI00196058DF|nr:hypothetical protein [Streptomyces sp. G44]MBM7171616.1 hypothetical protein [Streptomyces sp. G44]